MQCTEEEEEEEGAGRQTNRNKMEREEKRREGRKGGESIHARRHLLRKKYKNEAVRSEIKLSFKNSK